MIKFDIPADLSGTEEDITKALKTVIDPELKVNIVDLGLVYHVKLDELTGYIVIEMTLSSKYCPVGESILMATENCMERNFPAFSSQVTLIWEPEWSYRLITTEGMRALAGIK